MRRSVNPVRRENPYAVYQTEMANLASKLGQIGPKWDKSGTFYDQFKYILAPRAKMY